MRTIQSFILRLLVDTDQPDTLHGSLRCVNDDTEQPFTDEAMLDRLAAPPDESPRPAFDQIHLDRRTA